MGEARRVVAAICAAIAFAAVVGCGDSTDGSGAGSLSDRQADALVKRLRHSGNVLLLRHAATDSAGDMTADLTDCSRQRNLSTAGRRQAATIGAALERLRVSIDHVSSSPFCRTRDTARLVSGEDAIGSRALLPPEVFETVRTEGDGPDYSLLGILRGQEDESSNIMLVSHQSTIAKATGAEVDEGETLVIAKTPRPPGFRVVARLMPRDWAALAERR